MPLTRAQLQAVVARAFPGATLAQSRQLGGARYVLITTVDERLDLYLYRCPGDAACAAAALRKLRGEIDLPLPLLYAVDSDGATVGEPYVLTSAQEGDLLAEVLPRLTDEQMYQVGYQLGEMIGRVHRIAADGYGSLADAGPRCNNELAYVQARLDQQLAACQRLGLLNQPASDEVRHWFAHHFRSVGGKPALLHGSLGPETVLVRVGEAGWRISGLLQWESALGWSPAWEHVVFLDAADAPDYFSLRVGYGNGYDAQTRRTYEQVREHVLLPYRLLLLLWRMCVTHQHGEYAQSARYRKLLLNRVRALTPL